MRIRLGAKRGSFGVWIVILAGGAAVGSHGGAAQGFASTAPSASHNASHDIVMRMSVPVSCRMTAAVPQIRLTGRTDAGAPVDATLTGQGGLVVDCNTSYSMSLVRSPVYEAPARALPLRRAQPGRSARASADVAAADVPASSRTTSDAARSADVIEENVALISDGVLAGDMGVVIRVDGRGGAMESNCVMAAVAASPFVCHAFAGPDDVRVPPPRASASLFVTGAVAGRAEAVEAVDGAAPASGGPRPALVGVVSGMERAAMAGSDADEQAAVRLARQQVWGRRIGDRLTVSLSARY